MWDIFAIASISVLGPHRASYPTGTGVFPRE